MSFKLSHLIGIICWGGVLYAILCVGMIPGDLGHALCGIWGCMPPLQALAAMHGFWFVLLLPPAVWTARRLPPALLRLIGGALAAIGTLALVGLALREAVTWLPSMPDERTRYLPHRIVYVVATLTDVPLIQLVTVGIVCWVVGRLRGARGRATCACDQSARPDAPAAMGALTMPSSPAPAGLVAAGALAEGGSE